VGIELMQDRTAFMSRINIASFKLGGGRYVKTQLPLYLFY